MRQLAPTSIDPIDPALAYADMPEAIGRPGVRVNMVASVDGATAVNGVSGPLSGPPDRVIYRLLRSLTDVVLVAAGTVRAEGYKPAVVAPEYRDARRLRGQGDLPRIAVVSRRLDLDWDAALFVDVPQSTIVVTTTDAPREQLERARTRAHVITAGHGQVDLGAAVTALGDLGARHVLCEGGPSLNGAMAAAGLIDELCLTIAPRFANGDAKRVFDGPALALPIDLELRALLEEDGFLFTRYRVTNASRETG